MSWISNLKMGYIYGLLENIIYGLLENIIFLKRKNFRVARLDHEAHRVGFGAIKKIHLVNRSSLGYRGRLWV